MTFYHHRRLSLQNEFLFSSSRKGYKVNKVKSTETDILPIKIIPITAKNLFPILC